jgi:hypothetical protein
VLQLFLFIVALIIVSVLIRIITIFPIGPFLKGYRTLGNTDLNEFVDRLVDTYEKNNMLLE